ncbi:MAG: hypothetical protein ACOH1X_00630 [Kaistella sp.]
MISHLRRFISFYPISIGLYPMLLIAPLRGFVRFVANSKKFLRLPLSALTILY